MGAARTAILAISAAVAELAEPDAEARIVEAAELIETSGAKVVVTGMGKCSHIGRKIAATLQSTGQPAVFLHPGEALHGDMGMIEVRDIVLALSNSGETDEVLAVARYAMARGCSLLVITSKPDSPLANMATSALLIPDMPEGCVVGLAPMASAAAMHATGCALANELMVRRGFTKKDFLELHHGGYLGRTELREVA